MKIVLDSNILFSALISGKDLYIDIFRAADFYAPDFIFTELSKYQEKIIKKTRLKDEFISFAKELFSTIKIIPGLAISIGERRPIFFCFNYDYREEGKLCADQRRSSSKWPNSHVVTPNSWANRPNEISPERYRW